MHKQILSGIFAVALTGPGLAQAADYVVDTENAHASINFRIQHLGYSWLTGRFEQFDSRFSYDAQQPEAATIEVSIDTGSLDTNHAERDKHLKSEDFLHVDQFPEATFRSTGYRVIDATRGELSGDLTLRGVTRSIAFPVEKIGEGEDPWGGYRVGFSGSTSLKLADYGITYNLGPASTEVELELNIEGIRQ